MSDLQPNGSQSSSNLPLTYVVDLCERFELEWRGGGTPRIETYLEGIAPGERERLLRELLAVEVELRISQGENPTPEKLRMRYPDWGHAITIALERRSRGCGGGSGWDGATGRRGTTAMRLVRRGDFARAASIRPT